MVSKNKTVYVIPHTHWDREWYLSFEQFRFRLMKGTESLLSSIKNNQLESFYFDGQTIVLEDLEQVAQPETLAELKSAIAKGRIEIGPWYVLPDEFLISPESLIKNLQIGIEIAERRGSWCGLGYLPDTFGHISQLPAIFRSLGLEKALLFRGTPEKIVRAYWEGADGTVIDTIVLPLFDGYYNPFLNEKDYVEKTRLFLEKMEKVGNGEPILLPAGADHMIPHEELSLRLDELNRRIDGYQFKTVTFREYLNTLNETTSEACIAGEQRNSSKAYVLPGVLSSRNYLKRMNQRAEDLLSGILEPLSLFAPASMKRDNYERYLWKTLIQNHAHDSICGCSIDKVHRDNEQRFQAVIDGASTYIENTLSQLCSRNPESFNNRLYVFSLIPGNKKVVNIERDIFIPASDDQGSLRLVCEGKKLPMDIISRKRDEGFYSTNERAPGWNEGVIYKVVFQLPLDGISLREIKIIPEKTNVLYGVMSCVDRTIENDFYRITAEPNGSLTIVDRKSGIIREDMHIISSFSDHGDSYNYSAPVDDFVARAVESGRLEKKSGSTFSELTVSYEIRSPYSKKESRIVSSPVTVRIRLYKNDTPIEFTTSIDNRNQDRVVRLNFPLGSSTDESFGDTAFDYVKRKGILGKPLHSAPGKEDSMGIYSSLSSIYAGGITVSHSGINEYGLSDWSESERALTCTLLRSTSHLSVRDPGSRGGGAGPVIETPEGQCPGIHSWKYWLSFGKAEEGPALAKKLRTSHAIVQGQLFNGEIPGLRLLSDVLTVTSLKKTEAGDWQMRLYNPSEKEQPFILECHCALQLVELDLKGHEIGLFDRLSVNPKEILTLRIQHT